MEPRKGMRVYLAVHDSVCPLEILQASVYAQFNYSAKRNNLIIKIY